MTRLELATSIASPKLHFGGDPGSFLTPAAAVDVESSAAGLVRKQTKTAVFTAVFLLERMTRLELATSIASEPH